MKSRPGGPAVAPESPTTRTLKALIYFETTEGVIFQRPSNTIVNESGLEKAAEKATTKRNMAVVILGKPLKMLSDEELKFKVASVEKRLKSLGFKKVVFQVSSAFERSIYRE